MSPLRFRLQQVIDERKTSQSELSRKSGVSFATISRMCRNVTGQVSLEILDRLAEALDVFPSQLLDKEPLRYTDAGGTVWSVEERFRRATRLGNAEEPASYIQFTAGSQGRTAPTPLVEDWREYLSEIFEESQPNG